MAKFSLVVWSSNRGGKSILQKLGVAGGRSFSLTTSRCLLPSLFRHRVVRHALPHPGAPRDPARRRFPRSGLRVGFQRLGCPASSTKGGEWPLEGALSERRSPTCAAAPEGQSRPNSELPLRPPLDPPVSARARDRILLSSPENSRPHSLRALPLLSGPSGCTVPKANVARASSARAEGRAASPALPEALNYLPWARGSSFSAGAARASQVRRSWRSWPLPLAPRPFIRPRHPPSVTMSELPDPHRTLRSPTLP